MQVNTALPTDEVIFSASSSSSSSPNAKNMSNHNKTSFSTCEEKAQAIRDCLQGTLGSENVDLWQLRQLALLPGGLLSPSLRKSAWAKLTGVSDVVWTALKEDDTSFSSSPYNRLSPEDAQALQKDVAKTVWPIAEMLQQSKEVVGSNKGEDPFWYVPLQQALKLGNSASTSSSPHSEEKPGLLPTPTSVVSDHTSNTEADEDSSSSHDGSTTNTSSIASFQKHHKTPFSSFSSKNNSSNMNLSSDQNTLQQVLTQVLEQSPDYHYPSGLANIAALLLINLESPAFTCLLLSQLVTYPLYPMVTASSNNNNNTNSSSTKEFGDEMTDLLCRLVDHFHLPLNCDLERIAQRSMTWFLDNNSSLSVQMASRLLDVFLVSHPLLPLYVGAASLTYSGRLDESMEVLEHVLWTGLSFMEQLPPAELVAMAHNNELSISNPQTPAWAVAASAPTDWALLETIQEEEHIDLPCFPISPASSPTRRTRQQQQQQQNHSFETSEDASEWERVSMLSSDFNQPLFPELTASSPNKHTEGPQATHFYDAYPLAMCAAGLAVASSSKSDLNNNKSDNARTGILRFAVLVATMIALVAAYLQGLPQLPVPSVDAISFPHLVPMTPKAGWTIMKAHGTERDATTDKANEIPSAERMLHQYMFQGMKQVENQQAVLVPVQPRLKILQPVVQQVKRLVRMWKKVVSKVFRRRNHHAMKS